MAAVTRPCLHPTRFMAKQQVLHRSPEAGATRVPPEPIRPTPAARHKKRTARNEVQAVRCVLSRSGQTLQVSPIRFDSGAMRQTGAGVFILMLRAMGGAIMGRGSRSIGAVLRAGLVLVAWLSRAMQGTIMRGHSAIRTMFNTGLGILAFMLGAMGCAVMRSGPGGIGAVLNAGFVLFALGLGAMLVAIMLNVTGCIMFFTFGWLYRRLRHRG